MRVFQSVQTNVRFVLFLSSYHPLYASIITPGSLHDAEAVGSFTPDARAGTVGTQGLQKEPMATTGANNLAPLNVPHSGRRSSYLNTPPLKELTEKMRKTATRTKMTLVDSYPDLRDQFYDASPVTIYKDLKTGRKMRTQARSTDKMEEYRKVRDEVSEAYEKATKHENTLNLDKIANDYERRLSLGPYYRDWPAEVSGKSWLEDYLLQLKLRQSAINELEKVQQAWESLDFSRGLSQAEEEVKAEVSDFLKRAAQPGFVYKFRPEYDRMTLRVNSQLRKWSPNASIDPKIFFPNVPTLDHFEEYITSSSFILARAVQLRKRPAPERITHDDLVTVEQVIQTLPPEFDLEEELHHYAMIKAFEKILEVVRREATQLLKERFKRRPDKLLDSTQTEPQLRIIFDSRTEQDIAWVDKIFQYIYHTTPTELIEQLRGAPDDQVEMRATLDRNAEQLASLSEGDKKALRDASSDRQTFLKTLDEIAAHAPQELYSTVRRIKKEIASLKIPVEYELVDALHQRGIIDHATRSKLTSASSRQNFLQNEFRTTVMSRFKGVLVEELQRNKLNRLGSPEAKILDATAGLLAQTVVNQLNKDAQKFYMEAFQSSEYGFDKAMSFYDPNHLRNFDSLVIDEQTRFKAYVEACFGPDPSDYRPTRVQYTSIIDRFLSEIKIPQFGSKSHTLAKMNIRSPGLPKGSPDEILVERLPNFDERLSTIFLKPLAMGDWRLVDTIFERLPEKAVTNLNAAAKTIYTNRRRIPELEEKIKILTEDIGRYEETTLSRKLPAVKKIMESVLEALKGHEKNLMHSDPGTRPT
ncbi:hypothetical protein PGT21_013030 [Puccinia graminis f. sp. tritici]|uniref:Uncharacterized protein n=1 Tax=Puccinia graminis f. sp. tritici TaxID=56615 RepID=A0A5B0M024_PUCGR|nr:hypothetical protein PGT21_013030 [Puccinia graminis f. sp. tritici]KAA1089926.1 hypothetical protein PGTUg99_030244 [Puccinia graminis f. sp. tritici]